MQNPWQIIEKIIAVLVILIGADLLIFLFSQAADVASLVDFIGGSYIGGFITYLFNAHPIVLTGLFPLISGALLLAGKKAGWVGAVLSTLFASLALLIILLVGAPDMDGHPDFPILRLLAFLSIPGFVLLVCKPFQVRYQKAGTHWLVGAGLVIMIMMDWVWVIYEAKN